MNLTELYSIRGAAWWLYNNLTCQHPTTPQLSVLQSRSRKRVAIADRRPAGKTTLLCLAAIEKAHSDPSCSIMMIGAFEPHAYHMNRTIQTMLAESRISIRSATPTQLIFMNGSTILFRSGHQHVARLYGLAADHYYVDDFESIGYEVLQFLNDCVDMGGSSILMAGEPSGLGKLPTRNTYEAIDLIQSSSRDGIYSARQERVI